MAQESGTGSGGGGADSSELESFRQKWRAEVQARATVPGSSSTSARSHPASAGPSSGPSGRRPPSRIGAPAHGAPPALALLSAGKRPAVQDNEDDYVVPVAFDEPAAAPPPQDGDEEVGLVRPQNQTEPISALDHYERAVEKEALGSLGDSLRLYRKAFRMDSAVDKKYKNKHFPAPARALHGAAAASGTAVEGGAAAKAAEQPLTVAELIASFAGLAMEALPPPVEGEAAPPCPLATLPDEILVHVLSEVAAADVGDFVRLALVCRKLAYLVANEDQIWRRVCTASPAGFDAMHRTWQRTIEGGRRAVGELGEAGDETAAEPAPDAGADAAREAEAAAAAAAATAALRTSAYPSWQAMFRQRPRIRFNGCYISTVNYIRPGQASANLVTWNSPVHIVTYFRYLRFFRDGTVISLLTTTEPADVVHHLTRDELAHSATPTTHAAHSAPPAPFMQLALRGRWRMAGLDAESVAAAAAGVLAGPAAAAAESDVVVETEGVGKYYYRMELALRSAGKGTRNNKLQWRGFYSYNRLTDDWGAFGLKNDKPFFFSRVRSYGLG